MNTQSKSKQLAISQVAAQIAEIKHLHPNWEIILIKYERHGADVDVRQSLSGEWDLIFKDRSYQVIDYQLQPQDQIAIFDGNQLIKYYLYENGLFTAWS